MVTRTGMLMETRLRANEMERGGYHVEQETVRGEAPRPALLLTGGNTWC